MELREQKQSRCQDDEKERAGERWAHTAVTADSTLVVRLVVGTRTHEQTHPLVQDAQSRPRPGHLPAIFTEASAGDASAILEAFGRRYPVPRSRKGGRPSRPQLRWPQGLAYGQVHKQDQGHRVERVEVRALYGKARLQHVLTLLGSKQITTSVIERHNGTSR